MTIKTGEEIIEGDFVFTVQAGESLSARDAVYLNPSDGKVYKCDADDLTKLGFIGFARDAAATNANVAIRHDGLMTGFTSLTVGAPYYLSGTAGAITATAPTNYKLVGYAVTSSVIKIAQELTERTRYYTTVNADRGSSTTQFDITNPSGTTFRYTWDGTGTDPNLSAANFPVDSAITFNAQNFTAANNGTFIVTGSGANYVEVTNASGVVESNKTLGTGYCCAAAVWTKPGGLKYIDVELQGAGAIATQQNGNGGGGGGYCKKRYFASSLSALHGIAVPAAATTATARSAQFGTLLVAPGGNTGDANGQGGLPTGGDINIEGGHGQTPNGSGDPILGGNGGDSFFGQGGFGGINSGSSSADNGQDGLGYGSGGGSGAESTDGSPDASPGNGRQGIVIVTEFY